MNAPKSTTKLKLAGWLLMLGWLVATPGLLPALFATVALVDGEHGVELRGTGLVVSVVLTHGAQNAGKVHGQIHQHGLLGKALTCYAHSPLGQTDHVMDFSSAGVEAVARNAAVSLDGSDGSEVPAASAHFDVVNIPVLAQCRDWRLLPETLPWWEGNPACQHALLI